MKSPSVISIGPLTTLPEREECTIRFKYEHRQQTLDELERGTQQLSPMNIEEFRHLERLQKEVKIWQKLTPQKIAMILHGHLDVEDLLIGERTGHRPSPGA